MKPMKLVGFLSGAAALTLTTGVIGDDLNDISKEELLQRLNAAESRIDQLEASNDGNWITEQRAEEMRNLVYDVLADADTRASLLQSGITAGYDNGAVLGSTDGNWLLRTNLLMQQRFIYNHQDSDASDDDDRYGFENTRTKFIMTGHVVSPEWFYRVDVNVADNSSSGNVVGLLRNIFEDLGFDDDDVEDALEDFDAFDFTFGSRRGGVGNAYLGYDYGNGWKMKLGSMKAPLLREELVEAQYQLAVERSLTNYLFTAGYVDGIMAHYQGDQFGFGAMFSDGLRTGQTVWNLIDTDYAFTARGEWLAMGNWDQFSDFTSMRGSETGVLVGGAIHYQEGESDTTIEDLEILVLTADVSIEGDGWNAFGALIYSDIELGDFDINPWAFVLQGGVFVTDNVELFGRYEFVDFDIDDAEDLSVFTGGVNYYFSGHNAKWTTDFMYGFDEVLVGDTITGLRSDGLDEDGQFVLRTQLQILF